MNLWIKVGVQVPRRVVPCSGLTLHDNLCSAAVAVFAVHSVTESAVNLHSIIHFQLIPQPIPAQTNYKGHLVGTDSKRVFVFAPGPWTGHVYSQLCVTDDT